MRIRLYGRLADVIAPEIEVSGAAGCSVGELRKRVAEQHASAAVAIERSRAVIGESFVPDERVVAESDKIELLPPVSGG